MDTLKRNGYSGSPQSDWPKYTIDNMKQLVLRNTDSSHVTASERVQIPQASSDAIKHWKKVSSNARKTAIYIPLLLVLLFSAY